MKLESTQAKMIVIATKLELEKTGDEQALREEHRVQSWDAKELRQLRYRLGWSKAEMARCLNVDLKLLLGWETGLTLPDMACSQQLVGIWNQAESNSEKVQRRPIAELMMRERGLSQIHDFDVLSTEPEPILAQRILGIGGGNDISR